MMTPADTVQTIYRELFSVRFIHNGYQTTYENYLQKGISVAPDADTAALFAGYKMNYRFYNNKLICFVQTVPFSPPAAEPKVPFIEVIGDIRIRFLIFNSSEFFERTYAVASGSKKTYLFSNRISNVVGSDIFLTEGIEAYAAANDYDMGTIVQDGGNLYGSIQPVLAVNSIPLTDLLYWTKPLPFEQVVNNADLKDTGAVIPDENCFAVIDVYNSGTVNSSYDILGTSEKLFNPAPEFTIKFESKV